MTLRQALNKPLVELTPPLRITISTGTRAICCVALYRSRQLSAFQGLSATADLSAHRGHPALAIPSAQRASVLFCTESICLNIVLSPWLGSVSFEDYGYRPTTASAKHESGAVLNEVHSILVFQGYVLRPLCSFFAQVVNPAESFCRGSPPASNLPFEILNA